MNELSRRRQGGGSILWPLLIMGGVVASVALVAIAFLLLQSQLRHRRPARNARDRNGETAACAHATLLPPGRATATA